MDDPPIDETGMLVRQGASFALRRDNGATWPLNLPRVPVDLVGKRVRLTGWPAEDGTVDVAGVQAA